MIVSRRFGDGLGNDDVVSHEWLRLGDRQFEHAMLGARGHYRHVLTEQRVATRREVAHAPRGRRPIFERFDEPHTLQLEILR
jgi:hypothetical protein